MIIRSYHNLEDVRAKLFPLKRRKVVAPEVETSDVLPIRQKEKSLSSLVISAPKVLTQFTTTERSINPVNKFKQNTGRVKIVQKSSSAEPSSFAFNNGEENDAESLDGKLDIWRPINCLVKVANRTNSFKAVSEVSDVQMESIYGLEKKTLLHRTKLKQNEDKTNIEKREEKHMHFRSRTT